jgi:sulfite exporter TauE/SafE
MLLFATLSGSAAAGAAIMLAFGIGTLPALLMQGLFAARLTEGLRLQRWPRALTGGLLLVFGAWLALAAVGNGHAHVHGAPSATSDPHAGHVHVHPAASAFPDG